LEKIMHQRLRPISARRINMAEPYEVTYWSKAFGVSEDDLTVAVSEVGEDIERVRAALVLRFRRSHDIAAPSSANVGIKGAREDL
jgi:uncharacterized protein DUF3606